MLFSSKTTIKHCNSQLVGKGRNDIEFVAGKVRNVTKALTIFVAPEHPILNKDYKRVDEFVDPNRLSDLLADNGIDVNGNLPLPSWYKNERKLPETELVPLRVVVKMFDIWGIVAKSGINPNVARSIARMFIAHDMAQLVGMNWQDDKCVFNQHNTICDTVDVIKAISDGKSLKDISAKIRGIRGIIWEVVFDKYGNPMSVLVRIASLNTSAYIYTLFKELFMPVGSHADG
ncbi:MAG: hypothetical protein LBR91_01125 [Puniceicoccales bacterium]|jgi:hypothetical protein|nr:hypothetical protein [Puniceicoccales bacterium]